MSRQEDMRDEEVSQHNFVSIADVRDNIQGIREDIDRIPSQSVLDIDPDFDGGSIPDVPGIGSPPYPYHFQVEQSLSNEVTVRGGTWTRYSGGVVHIINLTGAGAESSGTVSIDISGLANGTVYIIGTLSDGGGHDVTNPDALIATATVTAPTGNDHDVVLIAHLTVENAPAATVVGSSILQDWQGGNITDFTMVPDGSTIVYDVTTLQLEHGDTSSVSNVNGSGGVVLQDMTFDTYGHVQTTGTVDLDGRYATIGDLSTLASRVSANEGAISSLESWKDNDLNWVWLPDTDGVIGAGTSGYVPVVTDLGGGDWQLSLTTPGSLPFWLKAGDNTNCYGASIGNSIAGLTIDLDNLDILGSWRCSGSFDVDVDLNVDGSVQIDVDTNIGGTLDVAGISTHAAGIRMTQRAGNSWFEGNLLVDVLADVNLLAGDEIYLTANGGDMWLATDGNFNFNGVAMSLQYRGDVDPDKRILAEI